MRSNVSTVEDYRFAKTEQYYATLIDDTRKASMVELAEFKENIGKTAQKKRAKELFHVLWNTVLNSADIHAAIASLKICKEISKRSMTDALYVKWMSDSAGVTPGMDLDVCFLHVLHPKDEFQIVQAQLQLGKV